MKIHLRRIVSNVKLTFEEFTMVLVQIEACLNSHPLTPVPCNDDGVDVLTPGHFLIGRPPQCLLLPFFVPVTSLVLVSIPRMPFLAEMVQ